MVRTKAKILFVVMSLAVGTFVSARDIVVDAGVEGSFGGGDFAPSYIMANRYGTLTQSRSAQADMRVLLPVDTTSLFGIGGGVELWSGWQSKADYLRVSTSNPEPSANPQHPARFWVQQLYADINLKKFVLTIGQKEHLPILTDRALSSGELVNSANARPMPGVELAMHDFISVPGTRNVLQFRGAISYSRATDDAWQRNHYNYQFGKLVQDYWLHHKYLHLRFNMSKHVSVVAGMQSACQFGGKVEYYLAGVEQAEMRSVQPVKFSTLWHTLIPSAGGDNSGEQRYFEGNHLGTWDVALDWRKPDWYLRVYYQSLWDDGSGIGKLNGFDGLYGVQWRRRSGTSLISGAVVEYIDFTNQSGPIHSAQEDYPEGSYLAEYHATGADNYYNNFLFNGYGHAGLSMGTPLVKSMIYNTDGYLAFTDNRIRGFHAAITGYLSTQKLQYRLMAKYLRSWGTPMEPALAVRSLHSAMLEVLYAPMASNGFSVKAQLAFDHGSLVPNTFGATISLRYTGNLAHSSTK